MKLRNFFFVTLSLLSTFPLLHGRKSREKKDPQCRHISANSEAVLTADIVLVGSGPGGSGFLHRLVRKRPDLSVIWIEKGRDFKALNWPEDIANVDKEVLTAFPRKVMTWITGYGWNNFGGGDAGNSGGANYLVTTEPYEVDVFELRNNSITPLTGTTELWMDAFENVGFKQVKPQPIKLDKEDLVSQLSSLRTEDGRDRKLVGDDLRYNNDRKVTYVHGRAASVILDENDRAVGIRGVRIDRDQQEYGGCVAWKATKAVILAGGVFNSFDLMVESGIGPEKDLETRKVPTSWRKPNEKVGKEVGDEHLVLFMHANAESTDQFGSQPKLIAEDTYGSAYEFWTKGLLSWFRFKDTLTDILVGKVVPRFLPNTFNLLKILFEGLANWGIGIDSGAPVMELETIPKPRNDTLFLQFYPQAVDNYMKYPFQSPLVLIRESVLYKNFYKIGVIIDDSKYEVSDKMCEAITHMMIPMEEGGKIQNAVKGNFRTNVRRFKLWLITKIGILKLINPKAATPHNAKSFTKKGCSKEMFASYYHYFGGLAHEDIVEEYQVKGVKGLYISDGSVIPYLTPGPSTASIMQTGMRVADAFIADIEA